jgi:RNA polymerase sigma-70 factor (ECF subfamily)
VTELLPKEPEALGLLALILHAEARRPARRSASGEFVPLAKQDPALWVWCLIAEAEALLRRASALGSIGRYQLEGALQSAHVCRCRTGQDNWADVVQLYDVLLALTGSPVVALNRALAIAELLAKTDDHDGARHAYEIAIGLERDPAVRRFLQQRQSALVP